MNTRKMTTCSLLRRLSASAAALVISIGAALSASAQATNYPAAILADNPSVYYRLEELSGSTAFDSTTNQWNATIFENGESTSPVLGDPGIDTNAFEFIGPGPGGQGDYGYVSVPYGPLITPLAADGTNAAPF